MRIELDLLKAREISAGAEHLARSDAVRVSWVPIDRVNVSFVRIIPPKGRRFVDMGLFPAFVDAQNEWAQSASRDRVSVVIKFLRNAGVGKDWIGQGIGATQFPPAGKGDFCFVQEGYEAQVAEYFQLQIDQFGELAMGEAALVWTDFSDKARTGDCVASEIVDTMSWEPVTADGVRTSHSEVEIFGKVVSLLGEVREHPEPWRFCPISIRSILVAAQSFSLPRIPTSSEASFVMNNRGLASGPFPAREYHVLRARIARLMCLPKVYRTIDWVLRSVGDAVAAEPDGGALVSLRDELKGLKNDVAARYPCVLASLDVANSSGPMG